ncbi:MAG: redox-regulated ATPase YchF, partial [Candidatus Omnitrophica bacterium]|nr:redox-regulated ATPase YchF [Candidatus Omnitrophota bacterium]
GIDPVRDAEVITTELLLKDLEMVERRLEKERKLSKGGDKKAQALVEHLDRWKQTLEQGTPLRQLDRPAAERPKTLGLEFLTDKPVIYIANVDEASLATPQPSVERLAQIAVREQAELIVLCAKLEGELAELEPADRAEMMRELGLKDSALPVVIRRSYALLQLVTFFTTASKMLQAWTVAQGTKAPQAAGVIHTDFEQKFIRAEVITVEDLVKSGGEAQARTQGLLRTEGREYLVKDGDVIHFRIG